MASIASIALFEKFSRSAQIFIGLRGLNRRQHGRADGSLVPAPHGAQASGASRSGGRSTERTGGEFEGLQSHDTFLSNAGDGGAGPLHPAQHGVGRLKLDLSGSMPKGGPVPRWEEANFTSEIAETNMG